MQAGHPWPVQAARSRGVRAAFAVWILLAAAGWAAASVLFVMAARDREAVGRLSAEAGLTPVAGLGVEIVLTDATRTFRPGENPSAALVQDSDLVFLNMMLWYGGARAVAVNGERITAQSTITSSGPILVINRLRVAGPFHVVAIGDPHLLRGVLETRGGFVERMRESGIDVQIAPRQNIIIPGRGASISVVPYEGRLADVLDRVPAHVILNPKVGLRGAAVSGADALPRPSGAGRA